MSKARSDEGQSPAAADVAFGKLAAYGSARGKFLSVYDVLFTKSDVNCNRRKCGFQVQMYPASEAGSEEPNLNV